MKNTTLTFTQFLANLYKDYFRLFYTYKLRNKEEARQLPLRTFL